MKRSNRRFVSLLLAGSFGACLASGCGSASTPPDLQENKEASKDKINSREQFAKEQRAQARPSRPRR